MDKYLEKIMSFINENTMLLIIICIFLIVILVIYLIDNTIKSKKLEKEELEKNNNSEPKVLEANIPEEEPEIEAAPAPVEVAPVVEESTPDVEIPVPEEETNIPVEEPETPVAPVVDYNIEELLNKDYSANNKVVENIDNEPKISTPVVEVPKNKYNNDKKLSDIFGKKEEPKTKNIETTQDFSDELDKILKKLNEEENSSLEETSDYTNMF